MCTHTFHKDLSRALNTVDNDLVDGLIVQLSRVDDKAVDTSVRLQADSSRSSDRFVILEPLGRFVRAADLTLKVQLLFLIDRDVGQGSYEGRWKFCGQIQQHSIGTTSMQGAQNAFDHHALAREVIEQA